MTSLIAASPRWLTLLRVAKCAATISLYGRRMRGPLFLILFSFACGSSATHAGTDPEPSSEVAYGEEGAPLPDANDPAYAASFDGTVDERVSTSGGTEGGVVVLWPRVITRDTGDAAEASEIHAALQAIGGRLGRPVDVRPEPQRVCPQAGCAAMSIGAVLLKSGTGCAVVATVAQPGTSPARLVPWAGDVELRATVVPFREPPEAQVRVLDFVPCSDLSTSLAAGEPAVEEAIRQEVRD